MLPDMWWREQDWETDEDGDLTLMDLTSTTTMRPLRGSAAQIIAAQNDRMWKQHESEDGDG